MSHPNECYDGDPETASLLSPRKAPTVKDSNWAVTLRHSTGYLLFVLSTLILNIALFVWVLVTRYSTITSSAVFVSFELLVTLSVIFDLVVEINYQGDHLQPLVRSSNLVT